MLGNDSLNIINLYVAVEDLIRIYSNDGALLAETEAACSDDVYFVLKSEFLQFFIESATAYAKKVIRKEIKDTDENRKLTWLLLCQGIAQ